MSSNSRLPEPERSLPTDDAAAAAAAADGASDVGKASGKPTNDQGLERRPEGGRSITMEIPGDGIPTPATPDHELAAGEAAVAADDPAAALAASSDDPDDGAPGPTADAVAMAAADPPADQNGGDGGDDALPVAHETASAAEPPAAEAEGAASTRATHDGSMPAAASPTAESDDEAFLRRVVLPATPPPPPADATPEYPYFEEDSDDDRTVISDPPSPEILAAMAPPTAPTGARTGSRLEPTPPPLTAVAKAARGGRRVTLSLPQLGGVIGAALLVGGLLGAALSGSDAEETRPISSARAEAQPARRGLPEVVPLPPGSRADDEPAAGALAAPARAGYLGGDVVPTTPAEAAPAQEATFHEVRPARRLEAIVQPAPAPPATPAEAQTEPAAAPARSDETPSEDDRRGGETRPARAKKPAKNWVDPFE